MAMQVGAGVSPLLSATRLAAPSRARLGSQPQPGVEHTMKQGQWVKAVGVGGVLGFVGAATTRKARAAGAKSIRQAFDPTTAPGAMEPMGYWDPCGVMKKRAGSSGWEWKSEAEFNQLRAAELKHGRVSMLALTGMFAATYWRFPGEEFQVSPIGFDYTDGLNALSSGAAGGMGIIFMLAGFAETQVPDGKFKDPLGWGQYNSWGYTKDMQNAELAHGRLAMSSVITLLLADYGAKAPPSVFFQKSALFGIATPPLFFLLFAALFAQSQTLPVADGFAMSLKGERGAPDRMLEQGGATDALPA